MNHNIENEEMKYVKNHFETLKCMNRRKNGHLYIGKHWASNKFTIENL